VEAHATPYAVLTGDLIDSTRLDGGTLDQARALVSDSAREFDRDVDQAVVGEPEFFRGDAWQLLLSSPAASLRVALFLRARLRWKTPADTRIAIGIGSVRRIDEARISLSAGEAFELSGHALDRMTGYFDLTAALPPRAGVAADWLPAVAHLCSELARGWSARQAEILSFALAQKSATHEEIAAMLEKPVKKQTVTSSLRSAHFRALLEAVTQFERTAWERLLGAADEDG
jgi:hypothetical protein